MKWTLTTILQLLLANFIFGQTNEQIISRIDGIALKIDSTKGLRQAIADGTIRLKGRKKPKGGFSDWYYVDSTSRQLVKIIHEQSLFYYDIDIYYFHHDSLVLATTTRHETFNTKDSLTSSARYYFQNDTLIQARGQGKIAARPEAFVRSAKKYLADWKTMFYPFEYTSKK